MSFEPERGGDTIDASSPWDSTQEYALLEQIYQDWYHDVDREPQLREALATSQEQDDPAKLLWSVRGYLVMLIKDSRSEAPMAAFRRAQTAVAGLVPELDADLSEKKLFYHVMEVAEQAIDNPSIFEEPAAPSEPAPPEPAPEAAEPPPATFATLPWLRPVPSSPPSPPSQPQQPQLQPQMQVLKQTPQTEREPEPETPAARPKFTYEDIVWKQSDVQWEYATIARDPRRLEVIRLLLEEGGEPVTIIHNNYASRIPLEYEFPGGLIGGRLRGERFETPSLGRHGEAGAVAANL